MKTSQKLYRGRRLHAHRSLDLAPTDLHLFGPWKESGRRGTDERLSPVAAEEREQHVGRKNLHLYKRGGR
jgi:hypothetical protein